MRPGKLDRASTSERDLLETAMALLTAMQVMVDEVSVRTGQAQRRTGLVSDVLGPAVLRLAEIKGDLQATHRAIAQYYAVQGARWRGEEEAEAD